MMVEIVAESMPIKIIAMNVSALKVKSQKNCSKNPTKPYVVKLFSNKIHEFSLAKTYVNQLSNICFDHSIISF